MWGYRDAIAGYISTLLAGARSGKEDTRTEVISMPPHAPVDSKGLRGQTVILI